MLDSDQCFFFSGKISIFFDKEIEKFLDFFCFPSGNRTNFSMFWLNFFHNLEIKKKKKKTIDSHQGLVGIFYSIYPSLDLGDKVTKNIRNKLIPNKIVL
jgi:hypothetical protein